MDSHFTLSKSSIVDIFVPARSAQLLEEVRGQTRAMAVDGSHGTAQTELHDRSEPFAEESWRVSFDSTRTRRTGTGLPDDRHRALVGEIDRMVERSGSYKLAPAPGGERGWCSVRNSAVAGL